MHFAILPKPMIQFADLLYTKLRNIDFEGRVVSTIRSMNFNDSVCISLDSGVSEPLYFTQGVKQGCSLSLYIASLGTALHNSKLGIKIGAESARFADDLVLISGTSKSGMIKLLKLVGTSFAKIIKWV